MSAAGRDGLTAASAAYLERRPLAERKRLGQFLTPRPLRERLLDAVPLASGAAVLDPGVGTGEFLLSVRERQPTARLVGWDVDPEILAVAREVVPDAELSCRSALDADEEGAFDVVVGNPPYFQLKLEPAARRRFGSVISGRPNIFSLFLHVGLRALRPGGHLAFVVPPSMNNGAYFQALRDFLTEQATIGFLEVHEDARQFPGAQTAVQLLVLRKGPGSQRHVFDLQATTRGPLRRTVLSEDPDELVRAFRGAATLWDLGYEAVTGTVVWNENRERLRRDPMPDAVPLVWASNIADGALVLDDGRTSRPQYVVASDPLSGPAIVVNRVVGAVGAASLRCALVEDGMRFVGENHVNLVVRRPDAEPAVGWKELLGLLRAPSVLPHVRRLTGNTQLSARELTHAVPLRPG
ncbi:MAG: HsdM family class I SAM-dependent methyltransferase [Nitriliruptorales bacterium]